jgi:S1-C subfamily serine protease
VTRPPLVIALVLALVSGLTAAPASAAPVPREPSSAPDPFGPAWFGVITYYRLAEPPYLVVVFPYVGLVMYVRNAEPGVYVVTLVDSPAERGGVRSYERVVHFGGTLIRTEEDLRNAVSHYRPGAAVEVVVFREGRVRKLVVRLVGG